RFAAITNYRDPARTAPAPRSRGELPLDFLAGRHSPGDYLSSLGETAGEYAGFNLLVGDSQALWYFSNSDGNPPAELTPGIYGLSNAHLDTPWPKSELGKEHLSTLLDGHSRGDALDHDALAATVADRHTATAADLQPLGLEGEMEQLLSSQFIVSPGYGTRSRTTLWTTRGGHAHWREQSFGESGELRGEQQEVFALS
ncbi:MAG: NRDE family protein, partial [Halioglobus sp.]